MVDFGECQAPGCRSKAERCEGGYSLCGSHASELSRAMNERAVTWYTQKLDDLLPPKQVEFMFQDAMRTALITLLTMARWRTQASYVPLSVDLESEITHAIRMLEASSLGGRIEDLDE